MTGVTTNKPVGSGIRLGAMALDHFFMSIIGMLFFIPEMVNVFANAFNVSHGHTSFSFMDGPLGYISIFGFAIYFCKDCINGRSIAKRILKLQVVNNLSGQAAGPLRCFVRNIFIIIWPIEVIVTFANPARRIGDIVAGTRLVSFDPAAEQSKINIGQVFISVVAAYGFMFLLILPFKKTMSSFEDPQTEYIESSYNEQLSRETEKLFSDSLGTYLTASVKVYDRVQNKPLKYVSVIFQLNQNFLEDDRNYEQLKGETIPLLHTKFAKGTVVGELKYVYKINGYMQIRTMHLD